MSSTSHSLWHFPSKLHKFSNVSWKSREEISKFGIVIYNARILDGKLGFYLMDLHSSVGIVEWMQF